MKLLRGILTRLLLEVTGGSYFYRDYASPGFPIRPVDDAIRASWAATTSPRGRSRGDIDQLLRSLIQGGFSRNRTLPSERGIHGRTFAMRPSCLRHDAFPPASR
jgi:hypothetical protein